MSRDGGRGQGPRGANPPRRVSGPVGGRVGAGARTAPRPAMAAAGATIAVPPLVRRRARRRAAPGRTLGARALEFLRSLPDHRWLDRAVRGRLWIVMLGVMLAGIVFMQVEVLGLGASIGRSIQQTAALQSRNELLRASVASLDDDLRIERLAAQMGMVLPAPSTVTFLRAGRGVARRAAGSIHAPDSSSFLSALAASAAATDATTAGVAAATPGTLALTPNGAAATPGTAGATTVTTATGGATAPVTPTTSSGAAGTTAPTQGTAATGGTGTTTGTAGTTSGTAGTTTGTTGTTGTAGTTTGTTGTAATPTGPVAGPTQQSTTGTSGGASPTGG